MKIGIETPIENITYGDIIQCGGTELYLIVDGRKFGGITNETFDFPVLLVDLKTSIVANAYRNLADINTSPICRLYAKSNEIKLVHISGVIK